MDLVVEGCTSQAIAARLGISQRTVESYRVQIMEKMQAPERRRARAPGHPSRPDHSVKLPPELPEYPGPRPLASFISG